MNRRDFLQLPPLALLLPLASAAPPITETHFPDRLHQFVWRNWELANTARMAEVAGCRPADILAVGRSMGLSSKPVLSADQLRRIYITVIRQNWHLLPNEQIVQLLGWTRERYEFTLKEDDFLDVKLGSKPDCERLVYRRPGTGAARRAAEIRHTLEATLGKELAAGEPPFTFVARLSDARFSLLRQPSSAVLDGCVDVSGWPVTVEGTDSHLLDRFSAYLREAMASGAAGRGRFVFHLQPGAPGGAEDFTVQVEEAFVRATANAPRGLLQAAFWMEDRMEANGGPFLPRGTAARQAVLDPRYIYPFFSLYGDPLLEPDVDPFPDGYLEKLARVGINGVWLQCVLRNMARTPLFPEFGERSEERLANLNRLTARLERFGLKAYLYLNEPRAMPESFYRDRPQMRGALSRGLYAMCTSVPEVRQWMSETLAHVFRTVPSLGGVFSITRSENFTNCFSHSSSATCPRCAKRTMWDVIGEVIETFRAGVRAGSTTAEVIAWDWAWPEELSRNLIPRLPRDLRFLSVSEWSIPIRRGGVPCTVGEYSVSVVGPGPRATANWALARRAGVRTMAKTQFNNSWELAAVPYVPVPALVARHCANLVGAGISGIMPSWTLGGYPSPNLETAKEFYFSHPETPDAVLARVAARRYGKAAAPLAVEAWQAFSKAFEEYPYGVVPGYIVPAQHGPANLLRARPTGVRGSMTLFPQDDLKRWIGPYPPEVARDQFHKMADLWQAALPTFRKALDLVPQVKQRQAAEDLAIAETCYLHFRSVANQIEFCRLRGAGGNLAAMREIARAELELARRQYVLARRFSVIAYEASNHYFYRPLDLAEKILNCQYLLDHDLKETAHG
jgi:hypothetical protein